MLEVEKEKQQELLQATKFWQHSKKATELQQSPWSMRLGKTQVKTLQNQLWPSSSCSTQGGCWILKKTTRNHKFGWNRKSLNVFARFWIEECIVIHIDSFITSIVVVNVDILKIYKIECSRHRYIDSSTHRFTNHLNKNHPHLWIARCRRWKTRNRNHCCQRCHEVPWSLRHCKSNHQVQQGPPNRLRVSFNRSL